MKSLLFVSAGLIAFSTGCEKEDTCGDGYARADDGNCYPINVDGEEQEDDGGDGAPDGNTGGTTDAGTTDGGTTDAGTTDAGDTTGGTGDTDGAGDGGTTGTSSTDGSGTTDGGTTGATGDDGSATADCVTDEDCPADLILSLIHI